MFSHKERKSNKIVCYPYIETNAKSQRISSAVTLVLKDEDLTNFTLVLF